jgi:hypothetical protein
MTDRNGVRVCVCVCVCVYGESMHVVVPACVCVRMIVCECVTGYVNVCECVSVAPTCEDARVRHMSVDGSRLAGELVLEFCDQQLGLGDLRWCGARLTQLSHQQPQYAQLLADGMRLRASDRCVLSYAGLRRGRWVWRGARHQLTAGGDCLTPGRMPRCSVQLLAERGDELLGVVDV